MLWIFSQGMGCSLLCLISIVNYVTSRAVVSATEVMWGWILGQEHFYKVKHIHIIGPISNTGISIDAPVMIHPVITDTNTPVALQK